MGDADATLLFTAHANAHANTRVPGGGQRGGRIPHGLCISGAA